MVDEADVVLESEGSVVLVDGEAEDVRGHLAVALLANVVLPENKLDETEYVLLQGGPTEFYSGN